MARDVTDDNFYVASGGKVPAKWTAPEVHIIIYVVSAIVTVQIDRLSVVLIVIYVLIPLVIFAYPPP